VVKTLSFSKNSGNYSSSKAKISVKPHFFKYRGFKAVRKHRENILLLVKMMYSSYGESLPCFKAGSFQTNPLKYRCKYRGKLYLGAGKKTEPSRFER